MGVREERTCRCGNKFMAWIHPEYNPYDCMCPDCIKKDSWYYHLRSLGIDEKIKCIKCGWNLTYKDCKDYSENIIEFKCKCCGLRFSLWHQDYYCDDYY